MALLLLMCVAVAIAAAVAPVLAHRSLCRQAFTHAATRLRALVTAPGRATARISEAIRLRLAAALLDLGNHLMLSAEERKAFRLRARLLSARAHSLGVVVAAVRAGAKRLDDVTLEIPIGERAQEGNPARTLALSCIVYEPTDPGPGDEPEDAPFLFWRVVNRASPGHRGPSVTVEVPDLERALISYYARPLRLAGEATGARFFDEDVHHEDVHDGAVA